MGKCVRDTARGFVRLPRGRNSHNFATLMIYPMNSFKCFRDSAERNYSANNYSKVNSRDLSVSLFWRTVLDNKFFLFFQFVYFCTFYFFMYLVPLKRLLCLPLRRRLRKISFIVLISFSFLIHDRPYHQPLSTLIISHT